MQYLLLLILLVVPSITHFTEKLKVLPPSLSYLPEVLAGLVVVYVVVAGARSRFQFVRGEYWLVFGAVAAIIVCGIFANSVGPGPIFAGLRYYLRPIPLFFLPAVYLFTEKQIRQQLRWLTLICIAQLPFAVRERMLVIAANRTSGDSVVGSFEDSSCLSIILICAVCVLTAMTVRGLISRKLFLPLFLIMLLPTTINETKATLILLPIGLLVTMLLASPPTQRIRVAAYAALLFVGFAAIFAPIYEYLQRNTPYHVPITTFFTDPNAFMRYVDNNADSGSQHVGRLDAIVVPTRFLAEDPSRFAFGLGIGNASHSQLGSQFTGDFYPRFETFLLSSLTTFLLELGVLGTGLVFVLYWMIFRDSVVVARSDTGALGAVAAAWAGVAVIAAISMPYKTTYTFPSLSYLFWYLSGVVAARRMILLRGFETEAAHAPMPSQQLSPAASQPSPAAVRALR
jgi:hypothetical protein